MPVLLWWDVRLSLLASTFLSEIKTANEQSLRSHIKYIIILCNHITMSTPHLLLWQAGLQALIQAVKNLGGAKRANEHPHAHHH